MNIMKKLLSPKLDLVFKMLFTRDTEVLADLINAVLGRTGEKRICSVDIRNPQILPEDIVRKFIILDILATDESGHVYDIEMQARKYLSYPERALYYLCKIYTEQLGSGEAYGNLKPAIGIHFLDYKLFPKLNDACFLFELRDIRHPELRLTDNLALHIFEFPKIRKGQDTVPESLAEWLRFLNYAHKEDETMRTNYVNPLICRAVDMLHNISADEETRILAEMREKALKDEASMLDSARTEGWETGRIEGKMEGKLEGEVIGQIRMARRLLGYLPVSEKELARKSLGELETDLRKLESEIKWH